MIGSLIAAAALAGITIALTGLYLLPVLLAWARHVPGVATVAVINILLGWTLAGWAVALALALRPTVPPGPAIQLVQHLPPSPPPGRPQQPAQPWRPPDALPHLALPPLPQRPWPPAEGDDQ